MAEGEMRERGLALLGSLGLAEHANKRPNQLSGGQRQRVAIARALANRPEIIVADEPTGALDTASTEQVFSILRDIADRGQTVIVVTHDPALAARADRRIHIIDGKIAEITERGGAELVCEAAYDQLDGERFRHPARLVRFRPDREARSCGSAPAPSVAAARAPGGSPGPGAAGPASCGARGRPPPSRAAAPAGRT